MVGYKYFVIKAKHVLSKHIQTRLCQGLEIWQHTQYFSHNAIGKWKLFHITRLTETA